jgi:hypothetical protein
MKKLLIASASSLAFLALAACSDTDETQTQSINEPPLEEQQPAEPMEPAPEPVEPAPSE